ncbi:hypothetical protein [uncultured Cohaesibacter sp.]|uniref:hypothetical protein n=1 Tax=uncultured Cohaesibacter sp. TaxID=1002546 RepID=UPI002AAA82F1|nr:hypothetical protein [uncultured Cohaesibacter sp.]
MISNLRQWAIIGFALFCLLAGLATIWLPIPTGVPLLALGGFLLIANSRIGRNAVRRLRKHVDWLDHALVWLEERAGRPFDRVLKTTRPLMTRHRRKREAEAGLSRSTAGKDPALTPTASPSPPAGEEKPTAKSTAKQPCG